MRIGINASDLDHARIDGTRIYIQNLLRNFGLLDTEDQFLIYHKKKFNPQLEFPLYKNYKIKELPFPFWWTQTRFALEMFRERPGVLWMPMHSLPYFRPRRTKTVVTIHDLAFKFFPEHYPASHVRKLNMFTDYAVRKADRLISISNSTKDDLLNFYPGLETEKIKVIYHGYNKDLFNPNISREKIFEAKAKYNIPFTRYVIYVGALQPRKNLPVLLDAFESLGNGEPFTDVGLVIAGDMGWMYEDIISKVKRSRNIVTTGKFETEDLPALLAGSAAFVLPSLYEGFGLPLVEAMACGTPVIAADNSSLAEIVGGNGLLFKGNNAGELTDKLREILKDDKLRTALIAKGLERAKFFSWEKCAKETLKWLSTW